MSSQASKQSHPLGLLVRKITEKSIQVPAEERNPQFYLLSVAKPAEPKASRNIIVFLTFWINFTAQIKCSVKLDAKKKTKHSELPADSLEKF